MEGMMKLGELARLVGMRLDPCWRKQRYKSQGAANAHLRALLKSPVVQDAPQLNAYKCRHCGWYHVGRMTKG